MESLLVLSVVMGFILVILLIGLLSFIFKPAIMALRSPSPKNSEQCLIIGIFFACTSRLAIEAFLAMSWTAKYFGIESFDFLWAISPFYHLILGQFICIISAYYVIMAMRR